MRTIATLCACLLVSLSSGSVALAADPPKADNSAQNQGAGDKDAVTAEKQGNKKSDVKMLAEVRKAIVKDKTLSMDAKNVKILYSQGCVTLKGPVDSDDEKAKVEEIAKGCAGVTSVTDMITVAPKKH
jgi:hyperosmotically inducible protein